LSRAGFSAPFTPAVEVGWRLAFPAWRYGYATEAAKVCLENGFSRLGLREIVSFTTCANKRSMAVMERIGMRRDPQGDFFHPALPLDHPQRAHVLYRVEAPAL